jgi:hypothetical protein
MPKAALFTTLALLAACTTTQRPDPSVDLGTTAVGSYALFSFTVEGLGAQRPICKLFVSPKGSKEKIPYALPAGSVGLMALAPGAYSYDHVDCGLGRRYMITSPFGRKLNEFTVLPGKLNYLGHTTLSFDSKEDLKLRYDQKDHLDQIKRIFANLAPTSWAATNTVSAYTQRNIRADMVVFDLPRSYSLKVRAPKEEQEKLKLLLTSVQAKVTKCADAEAVNNPLKIGALALTYTNKDGKFVESEKREAHVYTKGFVSCVQGAMASIAYSADYPLSIGMAL